MAKQRDIVLDITKFILSIMIVFLHLGPTNYFRWTIAMPLLRLAVPVFFLISAYLFFTGINRCQDGKQRRKRYLSFAKRTLILYFFWALIFFQPMLEYREWFKEGFSSGIYNLARDTFMGSTFISSWFIMALFIAVTVVLFLRSFMRGYQVLILSFIPFVFATLAANYFYVPALHPYLELATNYIPWPYNNCCIAFFWVSLGALFADKGAEYFIALKTKKTALAVVLVGCIVSIVLLYMEANICFGNNWSYAGDAYFALIPACISIMILLLMHPKYKDNSKALEFMQVASVVTYVVHTNLYVVLEQWGHKLSEDIWAGYFPFIVILVFCWFLSWLIMYLRQFRLLQWMKYIS